MSKIWEWVKAHKKWLVLPALVVGALWLVRAIGGGGWSWVAKILKKDPPPTRPPETMTKTEAKEAKKDLAKEYADAAEKRDDVTAGKHADFDAWMRGGGTKADPNGGHSQR